MTYDDASRRLAAACGREIGFIAAASFEDQRPRRRLYFCRYAAINLHPVAIISTPGNRAFGKSCESDDLSVIETLIVIQCHRRLGIRSSVCRKKTPLKIVEVQSTHFRFFASFLAAHSSLLIKSILSWRSPYRIAHSFVINRDIVRNKFRNKITRLLQSNS